MHQDERPRVRGDLPGRLRRPLLEGVHDRRRRRIAPAVEMLEGRRLLSTYTGPSANRPVSTPAGLFNVQVSGPGAVEVHHTAGGAIDLNVYGTTSISILTITQIQPRYHAASQLLAINNLRIRSGALGGLAAAPAELEGRMTPLNSSVVTFAIGTIGPRAQVSINGSVGTMSVSNIDLGPTGRVDIAGDINTVSQGGLATGLIPLIPLVSSTNPSTVSTTSTTSGPMTIGDVTIDGGQFSIGRDSLASIAINGDVSISQDGSFSIGRDQDGSFTVNGSVELSSGGRLVIGRNLGSLAITGNLIVAPGGGGVAVDGALQALSIDGYFQGQGGASAPSAIDLGVGLNLSDLTILGGVSGQGGLINANVRVGGSVSGVNVAYGLYNSAIQANTAMST
jgi:hypothetical protein